MGFFPLKLLKRKEEGDIEGEGEEEKEEGGEEGREKRGKREEQNPLPLDCVFGHIICFAE